MSLVEVELPGDLLQLSLRWVHVLAAVLWVGFSFWLEWVWTSCVRTTDPESERPALLDLLSRTMFWLRWGALAAWLTGATLLMILYYSGPYMLSSGVRPEFAEWAPMFLALFALALAYDLVFRYVGGRGGLELVCGLVWVGVALGFGRWLEAAGAPNRAILVHLGALFGTAMLANVWLRIWPCRRRLLKAALAGGAGDPADEQLATARSRHNVLMALPLLMLMLGADQPGLTGTGSGWIWLVGGLFAISACVCWMIYASLDSVRDWRG